MHARKLAAEEVRAELKAKNLIRDYGIEAEKLFNKDFFVFVACINNGCEAVFAPYLIHEGKALLDDFVKALNELEKLMQDKAQASELFKKFTSIFENQYKKVFSNMEDRIKVFSQVLGGKFKPLLQDSKRKKWGKLLTVRADSHEILALLSLELDLRKTLQGTLDEETQRYCDLVQQLLTHRYNTILQFRASPIDLPQELARQLRDFPIYKQRFEAARQTIMALMSKPTVVAEEKSQVAQQQNRWAFVAEMEQKEAERAYAQSRHSGVAELNFRNERRQYVPDMRGVKKEDLLVVIPESRSCVIL